MFTLCLLSLALALAALASPTKRAHCDLSQAKLFLPVDQTSLTNPSTPARFVGLAIGFQNYICNATAQKYMGMGAVAQLADVSCLPPQHFTSSAQRAYETWTATDPHEGAIAHFGEAPILGLHYFIPNPAGGTGILPKWDFTVDGVPANPKAFVVASKVAGIPAPTGKEDVNWLELKNESGDLATSVYRVDTRGGQPPPTCSNGGELFSVKYSSLYWFYGGSIEDLHRRFEYSPSG